MTIIVGESASDNWRIIQKSSPGDIWLHSKSFPGCHVIIRDEEPDEFRLMEAASICKKNSKYRFKNMKISYTPVGNLLLGTAVGSVHFVSNRKVKSLIPP